MADPVAWRVIESGWHVVTSDGDGVGTVHEVVGDRNADIFNGLAVSPGLFKSSRYVPAERVGAIYEDRVELDLSSDEFERLESYEGAPPSLDVLKPDEHRRP